MQLSRDAYAVAVHPLTGLQAESWRLLWEELAAEGEGVAECRAWVSRRQRVRPQLVELLSRFLAGSTDLEELRATFDQRTRTDWDAFGLRGMSGAMFLNLLLKHVADTAELAERLRRVLPAPRDAETGRERLAEFVAYLDVLAREGSAAGRLQPGRAAFFVSMWWHVQEPERWPGFQLSARRALQAEEGLYAPLGEPVHDYFAFREPFLALAAALRVRAWELEYLCWWHERRAAASDDAGPADVAPPVRRRARSRELRAPARERAVAVRVVREPAPRPVPGATARGALEHTHVQWLLARMGRKLGCRVWVAANDHAREWEGERLGALSVARLPALGLDPDSQRAIALIDVVWLRGANQVAAAFEVEHTTSIYSGLLRMADLASLAPNLNFPLYIVAPAARLPKVRRELQRPVFQLLELHRRCGFFSAEALLEASESIMRWASGPAAIERLTERLTTD